MMMDAKNNATVGGGFADPPHRATQNSTSPSWDDSLKPGQAQKDDYSDIYSALRPPGKQAPRPAMNTLTTQPTRSPSHICFTGKKLQPIVETADLLGLGDICPVEMAKGKNDAKQPVKSNRESSVPPMGLRPSRPTISTVWIKDQQHTSSTPPSSPPLLTQNPAPPKQQETLQDRNRRIQEQINENEKRLAKQNAPGFVPPHLRPIIPGNTTDDNNDSYLPPHLRKPRLNETNSRSHIPSSMNKAWPHAQSSNEAIPNKPSKVSVVLTPISRVLNKPPADTFRPAEPVKPVNLTMASHHHILDPAPTQKSTMRAPSISRDLPNAQHPISSRELLRHTNSIANRQDYSRVAAPTPPSPPPIGGTKIQTAYFPLPPESPPPIRASSLGPGNISSYSRQDSRSSYTRNDERSYNGSSYGQNEDGGQFLLLDHQKARKMRSYTRYRSKAGFAPHHPRLPFEFLHTMAGVSGVTYGTTIAGRLDSVSSVGPGSVCESGKTYGRPSGPTGHKFGSDWGNGFRIPEHEHVNGYNSGVALDESEDEEIQIDDLIFRAWPQPPTRNTNCRIQKPRSVVLSGLPKNQTLEQISRICINTGRIENIKMSKRRRMALVIFVDAYTAERFYETTDSRGITLVLLDDETNQIVRPQVFVEMNPESLPIDDQTRHIIDTADGSRVLRLVGWDREGLESLVGYRDEEAVSYDELLMRLASHYFDPQEGPRKVESVAWLQNGYGHMEATFVFAGINDAIIARDGMQMEQELEACNIDFGTDPCMP